MSTTEPSIVDLPDLLRSLKTMLVEEAYTDVVETSKKVSDAYDKNAAERRVVERSHLYEASLGADAPAENAPEQFTEMAISAGLTRVKIFPLIHSLETRISEVDVAEASSAIEKVLTYESDLANARTRAEEATQSLTLPAQPRLLSTYGPSGMVPKGGQFTLEATVGNIGDDPSEPVTVTVSSTSGELETVTQLIDRVEPGVDVSVDFEFSPPRAGRYDLSLDLQQEEERLGDETVTVDVGGKREFLEVVSERLEALRVALNDATSLSKGERQRLVGKLDAALDEVERAREQAPREKQANNQIDAAINILGAFLNSLDDASTDQSGNGSKKKSKKDTGTAAAIVASAEHTAVDVIDQLVTAKDAAF